MKKITGIVLDKQGRPLCGASVLLKNERFEDVATASADENGQYCIEVAEGVYPYMLAVRDYAQKYLEHWVGNLSLAQDVEINFTVDALEIYGLTCARIRSGAPVLSIYFRPMSLEKFRAGAEDIRPDLDVESVTVRINGERVRVGTLSEVTEFYSKPEMAEDMRIKGCFAMTTLPEAGLKDKGNFLEVRIEDKNSKAIGCAGLFFDK